MPPIQFATQAYQSQSLPVAAQRCVNFFAEREPKDAKSPIALFGVPGLVSFATCGAGPTRGMHVMGDVLYAVSGTSLYSVNADGGAVLLGGGIGGISNVSMDDNGVQLCIVNAAQGFLYQPGGIPTTLANTAAGNAVSLVLVNAAGMMPGDPLAVQLDTGATFNTTLVTVSVNTVTIPAPGLPSQATAGNLATDANLNFIQITSANFYPAATVTFFDNYFVFDRMGTNQFFISGLLDGSSYSGTDFASAEVQPDIVLSTVNDHETLLIFGERSIETWYDAGTVSFPFQRYDGGTIERGCAAALTPIKEDNSVFFLGDDLVFYRLNFNIPTRISTHAIENIWRKYGVTADAFCFSYTINGHKFVNLVFPSGPGSFAYDIATGLWHERESWSSSNTTYSRWRGNCFANCYGRLLIGDAFSGTIGYLDFDTFTEYGNTIRGLLASPPLHQDRKRVFMSRFELDIEAGVGLASGQGSVPQIMLRWSDDGGHTFSALQIWDSMGKTGEFLTRLRWLRMGQFRQRIIQVAVSDPVKRVIIAAHADLSVGM